MSINTAAIAQNSQQMFGLLQNAQAKTNDLTNDLVKISVAEKVSTPSQPVLLEAGKGQNFDITV